MNSNSFHWVPLSFSLSVSNVFSFFSLTDQFCLLLILCLYKDFIFLVKKSKLTFVSNSWLLFLYANFCLANRPWPFLQTYSYCSEVVFPYNSCVAISNNSVVVISCNSGVAISTVGWPFRKTVSCHFVQQ